MSLMRLNFICQIPLTMMIIVLTLITKFEYDPSKIRTVFSLPPLSTYFPSILYNIPTES